VLASVMTNDVGIDDMIRGQYATMEFGDTLRLLEQGVWWERFREVNAGRFPHHMKDEDGETVPDPPAGEAAFDIHTSPRRDHKGNWFDAIREGAQQHCNVDLGCSTMVAIKMGVEAYRRDKVLLWDAAQERIVES